METAEIASAAGKMGLRRYNPTMDTQRLVTSKAWSVLKPEERRRRELGATRLRQRLGGVPFYAAQGKKGGDEYWAAFYDSGVKE